MRFPEYDSFDAMGLAELVRGGDIEPRQLLDVAIERAEAANPRLNAIVAKSYERAHERVRAGLPEGPLRGVPFLLKDLIEWEGAKMTAGCNLLRNNVATQTHAWVERLEAAGAVVFAQTNTPEMGLLPITEPTLYGATKNPWAPTHSPGGSSGGSAAAVAARIVPMAHASDGGGSIRIPASACGLFGLKPSRGRNPGSTIEPPDGFSVEHGLSRTVRDSALLLDITRGPLPGDRWWAPEPSRPYLEELSSPTRQLRIAFSSQSHTGALAHSDCRRAVELAAARCEELGHVVEEARPDVDGAAYDEAFEVIWCASAGVIFETARRLMTKGRMGVLSPLLRPQRVMEGLLRVAALETGRPALEPFTFRLARIEAELTPAHHWLAWQEFRRASRIMGEFLTKYDVFLCPVLGEPPWREGSLDQRDNLEALRGKLQRYVAHTPAANTAGLPAMSVPVHRNASGLPIGAQFTAGFGDESTLFALAGQLEEAMQWNAERPPEA